MGEKKQKQSDAPQDQKQTRSATPSARGFARDLAFPEAAEALAFVTSKLSVVKKDCLVVPDTNALVLPYKTGSKSLRDIANAFETLTKANRLRLPAQVVREFLSLRPKHIGEVVRSIQNAKASLGNAKPPSHPMLKELAEFRAATEAWNQRKEYEKRLDDLLRVVRDWSGDDPVSRIYSAIPSESVCELDIAPEELRKEHDLRFESKTPPGYKDGPGDDGIGDFLIWKTILKIGSADKRDLVFVCGEKKADWCVRLDNEPLGPRPELVDEYRRASEGHSFHLIQLSELVSWFDVAPETIKDLQRAEEEEQYARWPARLAPQVRVGSYNYPTTFGGGRPIVFPPGMEYGAQYSEELPPGVVGSGNVSEIANQIAAQRQREEKKT